MREQYAAFIGPLRVLLIRDLHPRKHLVILFGMAHVGGSRAISPEQQAALAQIARAERRVELATIEALAEEAHGRADLPVRYPDPRLLARANGFALIPATSLDQCGGPNRAQVLVYSCRPDRREQGHGVCHALAHGLLVRGEFEHSHSDVYALTLALMAPKTLVVRMFQRRTPAETFRLLCRCNLHAPIALLRARVQWVQIQLESAKLRYIGGI